MTHESEVHAYNYILKKLRDKTSGWSKQQIMTQNELLRDEEISKLLKTDKHGTKTPENIIKVSEDLLYVIEAKNSRKKLDKALFEAKNYYANEINKSALLRALFISGLAGNDEEGYIVKSQYFLNGQWETITQNDIDVPDLLSKNQVEIILNSNNPHMKDVEISDEEFYNIAVDLNTILHANGIPKDDRAKFIASILLAILEGTKIDYSERPSLLVPSINERIGILLKQHGKSEFANYIRLNIPIGITNHNKYKNAIIKTLQKLYALNIGAAVDSDRDIVGQFYEAFLKYGNGAKDLGIVFTPRHITRFASEILDVNENDLILDPTCGTGGFLVAAYDKIRKKSINSEEFEKFKKFALYGIEDKDAVAALAVVNMIFRKDGKNNIKVGDCFAFSLNSKQYNGYVGAEYIENKEVIEEEIISPITKVLMNPPFAQPSSADKEYKFVRHALAQMRDGGLLFSVLPISVMIQSGEELAWRRTELLAENSLLSVITFPSQLFQPQAGTNTVGIIVKKGIAQSKDNNVLWARAEHDGFRLRKGKRLKHPDEPNDFEKIVPLVKRFLKDQSIEVENIPQFQKACPIDFDDKYLELVPEKYLDSKPIDNIELLNDIERAIREHISFNIKYEKSLNSIVGVG